MSTDKSLIVRASEIGLIDISLDAYDTAEANLNCAAGLPGAEDLDIEKCLVTFEGLFMEFSGWVCLSTQAGDACKRF